MDIFFGKSGWRGLAALLTVVAHAAWAQQSVFEREPNDTPADATSFRGPAVLVGNLASTDQDAYNWEVSDVDAGSTWTLTFSGVPGRLSVAEINRVQYTEDGSAVQSREKLLVLGSRDGRKPAVVTDLVLEPGTYTLGIAQGGGEAGYRPPGLAGALEGAGDSGRAEEIAPAGGYRLLVSRGRDINPVTPAVAPASRDAAIKLRPNRPISSFLEENNSWYVFEIDSRSSEQSWAIEGQVSLGRSALATLLAPDGKELSRRQTDRQGRFSFPDLVLATGHYALKLESKGSGSVQLISLVPGGVHAQGAEAEPNDSWQMANLVDSAVPVSGRVGSGGDRDWFRMQLDDAVAARVNRLLLESPGDGELELCLTDGAGKSLQCRRSRGGISLPDLVLDPGTWGVVVGRGAQGQEYSLTLASQGELDSGFEAEPNDSMELASGMPSKLRIKGHFAGKEDDYFRLVVAEEAQLWRFQVMGDPLHEVAYLDASGKALQRVRADGGAKRVRLDNVYLVPGTHYIRVSGKATGDYMLLARPMGPPPPGVEREPNDDVTRMMPLAMDQSRSGLLAETADRDNYRFLLTASDHIRLQVQPPADGAVSAELYWDGATMKRSGSGKPGEPLVLEGVFPPGSYRLGLAPVQVSEAEYSVVLESLPRFACGADCEPNDSPAFASALVPGVPVVGRVNEWRDVDWFSLPVFESDTRVTVFMEPPRNFEVLAPYSPERPPQGSGGDSGWQGVIPAGAQAYLKIAAWGDPDYRVKLEAEGLAPPPAPVAADTPTIGIILEENRVSAYREYGQLLEGLAELTNPGSSPAEVTLRSWASDYRWTVEAGAGSLVLAPGEVRTVPLTVRAPADAYADWPLRIGVALTSGGQLYDEALARIDVVREETAARRSPYWGLPDRVLGGFNLAWSALGGRWMGGVGDEIGRDFEQAFDGMAVKSEGLSLRGQAISAAVPELVVELAGTEPVEVAGVAISLLGRDSIQQQLAELDLLLSVDGESWVPAAREHLLPIRSEQAFVLETPMAARFAKLRLARFFDGTSIPPGGKLGELKIIAVPGIDISAGNGYNLAAPTLGGHVVWSLPPLEAQSWDENILVEDRASEPVRVPAGEALEWVIGFQHDRAARLARLEWLPAETTRAGVTLIGQVEVAVSLASPTGPWRSVGAWNPAPGGSGDSFALPAGTWARFVRFSVPPAAERVQYSLPSAIRAWEIPASPEYFSILGEWGLDGPAAGYELARGQGAVPGREQRKNVEVASAAALVDRVSQTGEVEIGRVEHWYSYTFTEDRNSLLLGLSGEPTVLASLEVRGVDGEALPALRRPDLDEAGTNVWEVTGQPGEMALIRVFEPPRNVLFLWDTSASVGAYIPVIYSALGSYARGLAPGRDAANLMPFGGSLLLDDWYGDPYVLETILNDYPRQESSSAAEGTLSAAADALGLRRGSKSIVLITDAATGRYPPMWRKMQAVRPRIFALGLSSEGAFGRNPPREQDLQQDWAAVNGGRYDRVMDEIQMEVAFDRAATLLRRPAPYYLTATGSYRESPGPGLLQLHSVNDSATALGAVELILDASGSMLQRMEGRRRIQVAREVLTRAVSEYIPSGTPLALRVFGHREANSCRTDLEITLGPLVPASAAATIAGVNAMNLARTPIAESLKQVSTDIEGASGRKLVLLVTDGEETCQGDPEAVIRALAAQGMDIALNIVGFAIDDPALESRFAEWAELGNGEYFSAADGAALESAILSALRVAYKVYDAAGQLRASGQVNGPAVELPQGHYRVLVDQLSSVVFEDVAVRGGKTTDLEVK